MARIEHVALWTEDLDRLASFYHKYFGAEIGPGYTNPAKGFQSCFLAFPQGGRLELMKTLQLQPVAHAPGAERMGLTHLALAVGSLATVNELTRTLQADGFAVLDGPRRTGDGYYESVVLDPDGNRIEITV